MKRKRGVLFFGAILWKILCFTLWSCVFFKDSMGFWYFSSTLLCWYLIYFLLETVTFAVHNVNMSLNALRLYWLFFDQSISVIASLIGSLLLKPLSPNTDQHQFSPNNIHRLSRDKGVRINTMITKGKMLCSFIKFF